jgi:hypothetical protein
LQDIQGSVRHLCRSNLDHAGFSAFIPICNADNPSLKVG